MLSEPGLDNPQVRSVANYYDENTRAFVRRGHGRTTGAIHRAVWGPGVHTREDAMHHVEDRLLRYWLDRSAGREREQPAYFLDLGCGIGGSLCSLASKAARLGLVKFSGVGVTISSVQVEIAASFIAQRGWSDRVQCIQGDYCELPDRIPPDADVAFAIESFVHGPSPTRFFSEAARMLKPGGLLMVCDDLLASPLESLIEPTSRLAERYRVGWQAVTLVTEQQLLAEAGKAGLTHAATWDLTGHLELDRPRDRAISVLVALLGELPIRSSYFGMLKGGDALQKGLKAGWLQYKAVLLEKPRRAE
ncbi:MAG TPA: class I SAM-dependent methyltransferase [Polyangiaceae bacterium]|nr:class I SAM-dependent methyltransferase [Polyangiaceae bacterium]